MIEKYEIKKVNNEEILLIYLDYQYEFGKIISHKTKNIKLKDKIRKFIKYNNINYKGNKVILISNNLTLGSFFI